MAVEDVEETTKGLVTAATSVIAQENPGITNDDMARELEKTLCLSKDVLSAKVRITGETEDEKVVREVMETPERFTVDLEMVLRNPMPAVKIVFKAGGQWIRVGPAEPGPADLPKISER